MSQVQTRAYTSRALSFSVGQVGTFVGIAVDSDNRRLVWGELASLWWIDGVLFGGIRDVSATSDTIRVLRLGGTPMHLVISGGSDHCRPQLD